MPSKIIRFPRRYKNRPIIEKGPGSVPCLVTSRWLQFPAESYSTGSSHPMTISVMTTGANGKEKKLCELAVTYEDLLRAINSVKIVE